jgi:hypothetical protein
MEWLQAVCQIAGVPLCVLWRYGGDVIVAFSSRPLCQLKPTSGFIRVDRCKSLSTALAYFHPTVSVLIISQAARLKAKANNATTLTIGAAPFFGSSANAS